MPKEGSFVKSHDGQYQFKILFGMYTDFEAILEPIEGSTPNPEMPYTEGINKHIPSGVCVNSKFTYGKVKTPFKVYRGEDCIEMFCNYISNEARRLYHAYVSPKADEAPNS